MRRKGQKFVAEEAWQLCHSSNTKRQNLEQDVEGFMHLVKENGWDTEEEEMISLWAAGK